MHGINSVDIQKCNFTYATRNDLNRVIEHSVRLRMVVAFWTIDPDAISTKLCTLLQQDGSFACVDVHKPTNIDHICILAQKGARMLFHGKKIIEKKKPDGKTPSLPTNLLHSKFLLFDLSDEEAELWVGSHNWTEYALGGINIETSLRVRLSRSSILYRQSELLLNDIRRECAPVAPDLRETYKLLQNSENKVSTLTLYKNNTIAIKPEKIVHVFGTIKKDYNALKSVGNLVYVTFLDPKTGTESIYESSILKSGFLPKANQGGGWTNLESGFWALHEGTTPYLKQQSIPNEAFLKNKAIFWVTLVLKEKLVAQAKFYPPAEPIPFVPVESDNDFGSWQENHGWVHPKRHKPPIIKRVPFENLEDYSLTEQERTERVYGDTSDKEMLYYLEHRDSLDDEFSQHPIEIKEKQPMIKKLVLKFEK